MAQKTMYKGINNSPVTKLTASLSTQDTTINITDETAFPDVPNIATIGTEDNAELVLYTGKTTGKLTGCTRGFYGTIAKSWPASTKIYRGYTAYDHDTFIDNIRNLAKNTRRYGIKWNGVTAECTRTGDASSITTDTTNFKHSGSKNSNYDNPFDNIYPWSGIRLCNIDLDAYYALASGGNILSCVKAWEGDIDFSYTDTDGVWRYTPEFWGKAWNDEDNNRNIEIIDKPLGGYVHYKAGFDGRWHGGIRSRTVGGEAKTLLLPCTGMPGKSVSVSTLHSYAKNFKATLDNIFSIDASTMLYLVEFADFNSQYTIGNGVSDLYRQSEDKIQEDATSSATVKVLASAATTCIPGAIMDIGTSNGSASVGSFIIDSVTTDPNDDTLKIVTLTTDGITTTSVTVTTDHFWSVHGLANVADEDIGSQSGYIGTNGRSNVYYRGVNFAANLWYYVLGAYRETGTGNIWIAHDEEEADAYDALDTDVHIDTGLVLPKNGDGTESASGYVQTLGLLDNSTFLSVPPFCTEFGGSSASPVGDYNYIPALTTGNTILLLGGRAAYGSNAGRFCASWDYSASPSSWAYGARPRLKNP